MIKNLPCDKRPKYITSIFLSSNSILFWSQNIHNCNALKLVTSECNNLINFLIHLILHQNHKETTLQINYSVGSKNLFMQAAAWLHWNSKLEIISNVTQCSKHTLWSNFSKYILNKNKIFDFAPSWIVGGIARDKV